MEEVVIYGSETGKSVVSTGVGASEFVISASELFSGNHLASYKQSSIPNNGLAITNSHIFAAQKDKALMHAYIYGQESVDQKIVLPEKMTAIEVSPSEVWLAAGSTTGRLYIWDIRSGDMVYVRDTHFGEITHLRFSSDSTYLVSGSADSRVIVWELELLVQVDKPPEEVEAQFTWTDHTLSITGLHLGIGHYRSFRAYTSSLDGTVRCWDSATGQLMTTYSLPEPVHAITVDPAERCIYCGLKSGNIYVIQLYQENKQTGILEYAGGSGRIITVSVGSDSILSQHQAPISSLALSFDATVLVSGDDEGKVYAWDLPGRQVMRSLKQHRGRIQSIHTRTIASGTFKSQQQTSKTLPLFRRVFEASRTRDIYVKIEGNVNKEDRRGKVVGGVSLPANSDNLAELKAARLEADLKTLYDKYGELKGMHEELWKLHVKNTTESSSS